MLRKRFSNKYIGNSYPKISNKQRIRDPLRISYSLFTQNFGCGLLTQYLDSDCENLFNSKWTTRSNFNTNGRTCTI